MGTPVGKEWPSESVISKDSFPTYPSKPLKQHNPYMSLDAYDFVQQCLRYDLGKRLSSRAALKHPFLNVKTLITKPRVLRTLNFNKWTPITSIWNKFQVYYLLQVSFCHIILLFKYLFLIHAIRLNAISFFHYYPVIPFVDIRCILMWSLSSDFFENFFELTIHLLFCSYFW